MSWSTLASLEQRSGDEPLPPPPVRPPRPERVREPEWERRSGVFWYGGGWSSLSGDSRLILWMRLAALRLGMGAQRQWGG